MNTASSSARPTQKQLGYLKVLARQTASTFAYPSTRRQASEEIQRLQRLRAGGRPLPERSIGLRQDAYATSVRGEEVVGYGAQARWRHHPPADPEVPGGCRAAAGAAA